MTMMVGTMSRPLPSLRTLHMPSYLTRITISKTITIMTRRKVISMHKNPRPNMTTNSLINNRPKIKNKWIKQNKNF